MEKLVLGAISTGNIWLIILVVFLLLVFWFKSDISAFFKNRISKKNIAKKLESIDGSISSIKDPISGIDTRMIELHDDIMKINYEIDSIKDESIENNIEMQKKYEELNKKLVDLVETLAFIRALVENINNMNNMNNMSQKQSWGGNPNTQVSKDTRNKF